MKNRMTEMKKFNTVAQQQVALAEERDKNLEDKSIDISWYEKRKKNKQSRKSVYQCTHTRSPEERRDRKG